VVSDASKFGLLDSSATSKGSRKALFGLDAGEFSAIVEKLGEPVWRGRQLTEAIYHQWLTDLDEITTLAKPLRAQLKSDGFEVGRPRIAQVFSASDGTERYLIECRGGEGAAQTVEAVWMPEGDGGEAGEEEEKETEERDPGRGWKRATLCVSSQIGCAVNCGFCLTARLGLQRNLTAGEIAGQVVEVFARHGVRVGRDRVNLVFMGMGEPFLNYDNFMKAVRLLVEEVGVSPRRMTVSTSGIVPGIERFALEPDAIRPRLAISLNAPNDRVRGEIMPVNRKWPITEVLKAVKKVPLRAHERVTFEYVLLAGVTDQPGQAAEVARLIRRTGLPAKVNLIAWNPGPGIDYATPVPETVEAFRETLITAGVTAYVRRPRGREIYAACGQLKTTRD
jgi:23S rRNA (adenine2503-C2)-methyltransferase